MLTRAALVLAAEVTPEPCHHHVLYSGLPVLGTWCHEAPGSRVLLSPDDARLTSPAWLGALPSPWAACALSRVLPRLRRTLLIPRCPPCSSPAAADAFSQQSVTLRVDGAVLADGSPRGRSLSVLNPLYPAPSRNANAALARPCGGSE